jgi:hypothetical protein
VRQAEAELHAKIRFLLAREADACVRVWPALKLSPLFTEMMVHTGDLRVSTISL